MDIKQKFNWKGFIDGKFAVHCDTEEKALEFLERCSEQNLSWKSNDWEYAKEDTCYYCINKKIYYASIKLFENSGKEILEWEIEFKGVDNMSKEYSFKEVIANIKEGETYILIQECFRVQKIFMKNSMIEIVSTDEPVRVGGKERYIKEQKPVPFLDAIKTYQDGYTIYCKWGEGTTVYVPDGNINPSLIDTNNNPISSTEILEGKWFIVEE